MRARCRPWLPLTTQQLRLRNLSRIEGVNIEYSSSSSGETLIYYTLHSSKNSEAFYTSEALPHRHMQQKWAEIVCPAIMKSNANCVCVKVWARFNDRPTTMQQQEQETEHVAKEMEEDEQQQQQKPKVSISALTKELSNACLCPSKLARPPDRLLFTWGVYFSGLTLLSQQTDAKCKANSLIFQMNGEYFASSEYFTADSLREQLSLNYQRYSASVPKIIAMPPPDDNFLINSPQVSRSSSPVALDWQNDLLRMSKMRYTQLNCAKPDVRRSYNLKKVLQLQELQRLHMQRKRESEEIAAEIKLKSLHCITKADLSRKPRTTSLSGGVSSSYSSGIHHQHHSMGRTLSVLLAEQQRTDPKTLLQAQQLLRELENLRCKQSLLEEERTRYSTRISQKRQQLVALTESRQLLQASLHERNAKLEKEQLLEEELHQLYLTQLQRKRHILQNVERCMSSLCMELCEIYPIRRNQQGFYTICDIPCPNMDAYLNDPRYASSISVENISPMALSASLGYVAHLVHMIATIIDRPLRNPIIHEGSRTRIMDIVKDLPLSSREFPLYTRSTIPSKTVKYAIYLLNQNIAQLCYDITGIRCGLRATIENILQIFTTLAEIEKYQTDEGRSGTSLSRRISMYNSHHSNGDGDSSTVDGAAASSITFNELHTQQINSAADCLSKSHSSVDMNNVPVPVPIGISSTTTTTSTTSAKLSALMQQQQMPSSNQTMPSSQPMPIAQCSSPLQQQRLCRSVGSYSDFEDDFKNNTDHCYSYSDSHIDFQSGNIFK